MDFDLAIEDIGGERYRARVLDSPSGQASVEFEMPFSAMELENFLLKIGRPRTGTRRLESPETEAARAFGGRLYDAVFASEVGTQWVRSVDAAEREHRGLRLRLRLSEAPQLADIPWEYLYSPTSDDFVVLSSWTPVVRYISLDKGAPPLQVAPPLRMLAMVSSPSDYPPLDVEAEWGRLDEGLSDLIDAGLVQIDRLEKATLRELQRAMRRTDYHLFHFIGHGGFDTAANDGLLLLETEEGRAREVSGRQLGTILDDARTVRVAVLNACEGARSSGTDPFAGVAQSLVARGIPAVVAMQFEITDRAAIVFAHEFYTAITDGLAIEGAVGEARRAIFGSKSDVEWGTAVLYMRAEDGRLFDMSKPPEPTLVMEAADIPTALMEPVAVPPAAVEEPEPPVEATPVVVDPEAAEPVVTAEPEVTVEAEVAEEITAPPVVEPPTEDVRSAAEPTIEQPTVEEPTVEERIAAEPTVEEEPMRYATYEEAVAIRSGLMDPDGLAPPPDLFTTRPPQSFIQRNQKPVGYVGAAGVLAIVLAVFVVFANRGGETTDTTLGNQLVVVETAQVAAGAAGNLFIDGDFADWLTVDATGYRLDSPVTDVLASNRLGQNSVGIMQLAADNQALYLKVEVTDDVYSQPNEGNQIWRGDAFTINLSASPADSMPNRPDERTFQLTMTPFSEVTARPSVVLFVGDGQSFGSDTTNLPVEIAGDVADGQGWLIEAKIPWSIFQLDTAPAQLDAALFAVFDNDGEMVGGRSVQAAILAHLPSAGFQQPQTWGTLSTP